MSFDLIFFNSLLYDTPNLDSPVSKTEGQNKEGVLVLCTEFSNPLLREFLTKILQAVKTNLSEDVWVLDVTQEGMPHWAELSKTVRCQKAIIFGIAPAQLGLHLRLPIYECTEFRGCNILLADSLEAINADNGKKKYLWRELQTMFSS